jgi:hypothetical protein
MSKVNDVLTEFLFPKYVRPYCTFRNATLVALLVAAVTALLRGFVKYPPEQIARWESQSLLHSPLYLSLYYLFMMVVLWLIYATRYRASWYVWRVWVYFMVLGGALIGLVDLILPLHPS